VSAFSLHHGEKQIRGDLLNQRDNKQVNFTLLLPQRSSPVFLRLCRNRITTTTGRVVRTVAAEIWSQEFHKRWLPIIELSPSALFEPYLVT
jgi:hypothetical protein